MHPNNKSKADNFSVESQYVKNVKSHAEFIANINTSSYYDRPFYSLPVVAPVDNGNILYLALRTEKSVAFLQITQKIELIYQMEFADNFLKTHFKISTFEYVYKPIKNDHEKIMLIGFADGLIVMVEIFTTKFFNNFNVSENGQQEPFKKSPVMKLCMIPFKEQFLAGYGDSSIIKFSIQNSKGSQEFYQEILKQEDKISFEKHVEKMTNKRKILSDGIEIGVINEKNFEMYALYSTEESKNPLAFFKLKTSTLSDFLVLTPEHYAYTYTKKLKNQKYEPLLICYTGFDGYFRIVDIHNLEPIYLFKSNYGGINSIVFENDTSPIVALGCQDDSCVVLNIQTNKYVRITGHMSFISRAIFQEIHPEVMRIITSSYDGSIGIKEFPKEKILGESEDIDNNNLPIKVIYKDNEDNNLELEEKEIVKINMEGIGFIEGYDRYIFTSAFDGCCSTWNFMDFAPAVEEENQNQVQNSNQKTNSKRNN